MCACALIHEEYVMYENTYIYAAKKKTGCEVVEYLFWHDTVLKYFYNYKLKEKIEILSSIRDHRKKK